MRQKPVTSPAGRKDMKILALIFITLVEAEFGLHVVYHAITGKAGLDDPAFDYLVDIYRAARRWIERVMH